MYSEDLLWRIVWLMLLAFSPTDIAFVLSVSVPTVYRVWDVYQRYGVVRLRHQGGRISGISEEDKRFIDELVARDPALYLDEYQQIFEQEQGKRISSSTLLRIFHSLGISRKRLTAPAAEASADQQANFILQVAGLPAHCFVWIDEVRCDRRNANRMFGRSARGKAARRAAFFLRGRRYSSVGMMACDQWLGQMTVRGPINGADLCFFADNYLVPAMNPYAEGEFVPRSVLVLDNCNTHYSLQFHRILHDAGIKVIFLPAYSPQFNPIEESFAKVKKFLARQLNKVVAAGYSDMDALELAFLSVSPADCAGYARNAGYE